jgi:primosomal protein N' (replication factor Y)
MAEVTAFLEQAIEQAGNPANGLALHGPLPAPMPRRAGYQRAQVLIEASQRKRMQAFLPEWLARVRELPAARKLRWSIDVDPVEMG